jgi:hypothetical protein
MGGAKTDSNIKLAALYHERWEIETPLDELKTHLRRARIVLRSKTPELLKQEFYGLLMAHFAVRSLRHEAALQAAEDPDRPSFLHTVRIVQRRLPPPLPLFPPRHRKAFHNAILEEILQERCLSGHNRINPRGVKRKMSNYPSRPRGRTRTRRIELNMKITLAKAAESMYYPPNDTSQLEII